MLDPDFVRLFVFDFDEIPPLTVEGLYNPTIATDKDHLIARAGEQLAHQRSTNIAGSILHKRAHQKSPGREMEFSHE